MIPDAMNADDILSLRGHDAYRLFGKDHEQVFRRLIKQWHPDISKDPRADDVMRHLLFLRRSSANGTKDDLIPIAEIDTGRRWFNSTAFAWSFEKEPDLAEVFVRNLRRVPFADEQMREQMRQMFPKKMREIEHDGAPMIMFPHQNSAILSDWLKTHGPIPPIHVAWIGSGLMNIAAYTAWSGWTLPGIGPDTVAIDPATHKVFLFAGWEAAAAPDERPVVASKRTLALCPSLTTSGRLPPSTLTLDVVRRTLREVLGDPSGLVLEDKGVPEPMVNWINGPSLPDSRMDYHSWHNALERSFGKRRFVKWDKEVSDVYFNI